MKRLELIFISRYSYSGICIVHYQRKIIDANTQNPLILLT